MHNARTPALIFFTIFAFLVTTFAQSAPQSYPPASDETVYNENQNEAQANTAARLAQAPVVQYADDRLAVISWTTATPTEGRVYYGTDRNNLNQVAEDRTNAPTHRVHLTTLTPSTTYYFEIDTGSQPPQTFTFRTPATGGAPLRDLRASMAPETNTPAPNAGISITSGPTIQFADDRSAVITWSTASPAPSALYYGTTPRNLSESAFGESNTVQHRVYLNNLVPGTTYYIQVDTGSPQSPVRTFQTVATGAAPVYNQAAALWRGTPPASVNTNAVRSDNAGEPRLGRREEPPVYRGGMIVPAGTEIQAKLETALSSKTSRPGDQFTALVLQPVNGSNGRVAIPAGARIRGEVSGVEQGKVLASVRGKARLNLKFNDVMLAGGTVVPLEATLVNVGGKAGASANEEGQVSDRTTGREVAKDVGIGAGIGTVAGLIFGSALKGLAIGAIAGGGYVLATQGRDVNIPQDAQVVLKLDRALSLPPNAATNNPNTR